ncbi:hypothetical protein [Mycobacteroides abscessus]|uniref:hypothetical protein n=1 Tax=Mycobacteroides abscessus TaxID=36809 RepID=UPI000927D7C3|nr:hypothetical protein [Mycobacteroides abscessus]SHX64445.1 Uncharacterised protein [Mycobacteroides abscessus subsp. abscessus]SHZ18561.1 Uncharacterised protein [Mycobacteroides abscessus subsp. abscessus]SIB50713.1 Uncharacterised protein [Mycobacteroides abscessus subsp. abscessus]SIF19070.1 Uncharacterised protein [Mycobacteroides abscessus subsp. abscessus]SKI48484.1 Uncharacterised protein [Mycobacteroides abscessus subsp. abscessus]
MDTATNHLVAEVHTTIADGEPGMNDAALSLLTGEPVAEVRRWMSAGGLPAHAARAGRRRGREACAAMGEELGMLDALVYYAIRESATLLVDGETVVDAGRYVGGGR